MNPRNDNHETFIKEASAVRCALCPQAPDGSRRLFDYNLKCRALDIGMQAPSIASEDAAEGSGVGSGSTVVVVNTNESRADSGVLGNNMINASGVDGVVSNVFSKEAVVKVDVEPTMRTDLCCETYCCLGLCSGGQAFFFKMPDCLGAGYSAKALFGECAGTCKVVQKPTFCECVGGFTCLDMSTCCSNGGDNDDTCCTACSCSNQQTWCCICQEACRVQLALMRTCIKCWMWELIWDERFSCPPSSASPMQCTICGFGYRFYENGGLGCRLRADTDEANATVSSNTTVVVVNS